MVSAHVHVAVAVQVVGDESHLPSNDCDELIGLVIFFAGEGFHEAL